MFNAERLLGGMIKRKILRRGPRVLRALTRPGFGSGTGAALGLGAIGIAFAAFEHFAQKKPSASPPPPPGSIRSAGPPPPPSTRVPFKPPPPPPKGPPGAEDSESPLALDDEEALLLVQAMVAAAGADGFIDDDERKAILDFVRQGGLESEAAGFVEEEMRNPKPMHFLVSKAGTPEMKRRLYAVSMLAIEVDSFAERDYLERLARLLGIPEAQRRELQQTLS